MNGISAGPRPLTFRLNGVTINSAANGVFLDGDFRDTGAINATITASTITLDAGFDGIRAVTNGTATQSLNASGNVLNNGAGTIQRNEIAGDSSGVGGLAALNSIPAGNVLIHGNAIDFNQPALPTP